MLRIILLLSLCIYLYANNEKRCIVPDILLQTIKLTENSKDYPYYIRTNENSTLKKFNTIVSKYQYKKTDDNMLIDCISIDNCIKISSELISNNIKNLDLGLFQINYKSFKYPIYSYFNENKSYVNACEVIEEKIKMNKSKWSWEVLASYHSMTPKYNKIYKEKLIKNYKKLTQNYKEIDVRANDEYVKIEKYINDSLVMY